MKRYINAILRRIMWGICLFLPIDKEKIIFSSYYGRGYGDNPRYIAEELYNSNKSYKLIWLIKDESEQHTLPSYIKAVRMDSLRGIYHFTTAYIWIDNCRKSCFYKKENQFYIQTWHGGGAQKKCELDVIEKLGAKYEKMAIWDAKNTDLMISESRFMTDLYHRSFWYDGPVYECGYPRYDIILKADENLVSKVYKYFNIEKTKGLVLYAPTFRADHSFKAYNIDFERLRINLQKRFGKEYVILVHLHPNVANVEGGIEYDATAVINSTFYPDTQELIAVSDILIGDYSSINYDFSLKRLPVFRYVSDLEEYRNDRDLYFPFDEYPYPYAQNNDELEMLILNFNNEKYLENLDKFFEKIGAVIVHDASQKIADLILDYVCLKNKKEFFKKNKGKFID